MTTKTKKTPTGLTNDEIKDAIPYWATARTSRILEWATYLEQSNLQQARDALCEADLTTKCCLGHAEDIVGHSRDDRYWETQNPFTSGRGWGALMQKNPHYTPGCVGEDEYVNDSDNGELTESARDWFGFDNTCPQLLVPDRLRAKRIDGFDGRIDGVTDAIALNDEQNFKLEAIAACVRFTVKAIRQVRRKAKKKVKS